jgi:3-oxoacyl-[acyl-carrier protein] reductase
MGKLTGKVVLVTGASRGIGKAIAIELSKQGASIAINCSKDIDGAEKTLEEIMSNGGYGKIFKSDISKAKNCKDLIQEVINTFGRIDILVNNAGRSKIGLIMDFSDEDIEDLINTNLLGAMYLSKYAIANMISRGSGNIINISSIWGEVGASCEVAYSVSKAGIDGMTKSLAKELGPSNIRVNSIAPGVIDTEMNSNLDNAIKEEIKNETPLNKIGKPIDIYRCVKWLIEDEFTTGQVISPNGGYVI